MRKKILAMSLASALLPLSSCAVPWEDSGKIVEERSLPFYNLSEEYSMSATSLATHFDANGVPYVDVGDYLQAMDGMLIDASISQSISTLFNTLTLTVAAGEGQTLAMELDWSNNTIEVNSTSFFTYPTHSPSVSDFSSYYRQVAGSATASGTTEKRYEFNPYGIDFYHVDGQVLVPFSVLNLLFGSQNMYNVYFNGEAYYGIDYYLTSDHPRYEEIQQGPWKSTLPSEGFQRFNYGFLCFAMDNFYGLKDFYAKGISFDEYLTSKGLKEQILSTQDSESTKGYLNFLMKDLDELHTSIITANFFSRSESISTVGYRGPFRQRYYAQGASLLAAQETAFGTTADGAVDVPPVRYYPASNPTVAILHFDSFQVGTQSQIEGSEPWRYDTYEFMRHYLSEIRAKGNVQKVVIDLATNGGGAIAGMIRALGFLTDRNLPYAIRYSDTGASLSTTFEVDADGDGSYADPDAYSEFQYSVLTSVATFSAANYFTSIFRSMGLGKVIGQTSGGGMCAVLPIVLPDGTGVAMSGPMGLYTLDSSGAFQSVQGGVTPDATLDTASFYDDATLASLA